MAVRRVLDILNQDGRAVELEDGRIFSVSGLELASIHGKWEMRLQDVEAKNGLRDGSILASDVSGWHNQSGMDQNGEFVVDVGDNDGGYQVILTLAEVKSLVS